MVWDRVKATKRFMRDFKGLMANFDTHAPEECIITLISTALDYVFIFGGKSLACLKYIFDDVDFQQACEYHRLLMEFLCYNKQGLTPTGYHCLFRYPLHTLQLSSPSKVYDNARVIVAHPNLNEVVSSLTSLWIICRNCKLMKDPYRLIKNICSQFRLEKSKEFDQNITQYLEQNPQGRHGRHKYSFPDYGLSEVELRYRFNTYSKTFLEREHK